MSKALVKIPKGTQCKNGICEQDLELEIDLPELPKVSVNNIPQPKVTIPEVPQFTPPPQPQHTHEHKEIDAHDELAKLLPKASNYAKCPNGQCGGHLIKNAKGVNTKFKKCVNCGNNGVPKSSDYCPTCGINEPDDWDESDLEIPVKDDDDE